jgi:N-acetylglucosamine-6-phosphate deacetylase
MRIWIQGGTIITPETTLSDSVVIIEDGRISAIEPRLSLTPDPIDTEVITAEGMFVMPGLIDIHVHGSAGSDTMDATPAALTEMSVFFLRHGVTSFLATTISQSTEKMNRAIENISQFMANPSGARPLGIHLEGPYLSRAFRGAHPSDLLRNPDPKEYRPWLQSGVVRTITIAPELPGALDLIREGTSPGVRFSAGHTQANPDEIKEAVDAGLRLSTHTFNGMAGLHHRDLGTVGALLSDDRVFCEIISDGIHVHPEVLKLVIRIKGLDHTILVTDAMRAAGLVDGEYDLGGQSISVGAGVARTQTGGLAGSTLTLDQAIKNIQKFANIPLHQAVRLATLTPASVLGLKGRKGELRAGADADILIADSNMNIKVVMIDGKIVYRPSDTFK